MSNMVSQEAVDALLSLVSDKELRDFTKDYLGSHPEMFNDLKNWCVQGPDVAPPAFDYRKEVEQCYRHYMKKVRWGRSWSEEPDYLDWEEVGNALRKVVQHAAMQIVYDKPQKALETALMIIEKNITQYEDDMLCEREDWNPDDLCMEECFDLIKKAFDSPALTARQKLDFCDRLEVGIDSELYDCYDFDPSELIDSTREALLSPDEQLQILMRNFKGERSEWVRNSLSVEIWDFFINLGRKDDAVRFYNQNRGLSQLRERYVGYLVSEKRNKEAVAVVDEAINAAKKKHESGTLRKWRELKLSLLEKMKDEPGIIAVCRELFLDANNDDALKYYHKIKALIQTAEWPAYRDRLLEKYNDYGNAGSPLSAIYAEEHLYDRLYNVLMTSKTNRIRAIHSYMKLFDLQHQESLAASMEGDYISPLRGSYTRNDYHDLCKRIKSLSSVCPACRQLALKAYNYYFSTYTNRPALREELLKIKI